MHGRPCALSTPIYADEVKEARFSSRGGRVGACLLVILALAPACTTSGVGSRGPSGSNHRIVVHADQVVAPFDRRLLGTNVPAWLGAGFTTDEEVKALLLASGATMIRMPGGSWSDAYDWLGASSVIPTGAIGIGRFGRRNTSLS